MLASASAPIPPSGSLGPFAGPVLGTPHTHRHQAPPHASKQDRSARSSDPKFSRKNRRGKPPPHPVTISFLRYCGPGQVPCRSLSSQGCLPLSRCVSSSTPRAPGILLSQTIVPVGSQISVHNTQSHSEPHSCRKPNQTRRPSPVTRHPSPRPRPPLPSSPQARRCRLLCNLYRPPPNQPVTRVLPHFFLLPSPTPLANPFKHQPAPDHPRRVSLPPLAALCGS